MKKKIAVLVVAAVLCVALTVGCIDEETTTVNIDTDNTWSNQSQKEVSEIQITIEITEDKTVITGKLVEITFNYRNADILVFQEKSKKVVFCAGHAEELVWVVGETYKVTTKVSRIDGKTNIIDAKIVNDIQIA